MFLQIITVAREIIKMKCKKLIAMILVVAMMLCNMAHENCYVKAQQDSSEDLIQEDDLNSEEEMDGEETEQIEMDDTEESQDDSEEEEELEDDRRIELKTEITAKWAHHYNANVTITNISDEKIDDWEITVTFKNRIEHIWNAKVTEENQEDNLYTIKNADWNQDIEKENSVTFGMTVYYEDEVEEMQDYYLTRINLEADVDYEVNYKEYSRWANKVNGEITITNNSERRIEDWKLGLTSNLTFEQVWNAEYVSDEDEDILENKGYNQNIEPGQTVSFGFIAVCDDENVELYADTLYEMITCPEEMEGDPDWEEEYESEQLAYYELYPDDFSDAADYEDYVAKRKELGLEIPVYENPDEEEDEGVEEFEDYPELSSNQKSVFLYAQALAKKKDNKKKTLRLNSGAVEAKFINAGTKGIQAYYRTGGNMYAVQRYSDGIKITRCVKKTIKKDNKISANLKKIWDIKPGDVVYDLKAKNSKGKLKNEIMTLKGFQHGQTLEMFTYKKETYMLVTAGDVGQVHKIAVLKFGEGTIEYGKIAQEKSYKASYLTGMGYANKAHKNKGTVLHTEAALSPNKKTLLIWSQVQQKGKSSEIQLSCLRMSDLMPQMLKARNKAYKKNKRAKISCKNIDVNSFICSAIQSRKKGNWGKPYGSLQSIDITNQEKNGQYRMFVAGGNDEEGLKCSIMISTIDKKGVSQSYKPRKVTSTILGLSKQKEMEGMHYGKDENVHFILTAIPKNTVKLGEKKVSLNKNVQVLFKVDASKVDRR